MAKMKLGIHPPIYSTVIQGKDGTIWVKRWPLGRPFLTLEVDLLQHKLWERSPVNLNKTRNTRGTRTLRRT